MFKLYHSTIIDQYLSMIHIAAMNYFIYDAVVIPIIIIVIIIDFFIAIIEVTTTKYQYYYYRSMKKNFIFPCLKNL